MYPAKDNSTTLRTISCADDAITEKIANIPHTIAKIDPHETIIIFDQCQSFI